MGKMTALVIEMMMRGPGKAGKSNQSRLMILRIPVVGLISRVMVKTISASAIAMERVKRVEPDFRTTTAHHLSK
jgi:hypothetical protein